MYWIDILLVLPYFIVHDAGKSFLGAVFQSRADMLHIEVPEIRTEEWLQMAIRPPKIPVGFDRFVPILAIFEALLRLGHPNYSATPFTFKRTIALRHATVTMLKHIASTNFELVLQQETDVVSRESIKHLFVRPCWHTGRRRTTGKPHNRCFI